MTDVEKDLDDLLDAARRDRPDLPASLSRHILSDAMRVQAGFGDPARARWRDWLAALGGWPALGGMATACAVGVWLGVSPPEALPDPLPLLSGSASEPFPGDDLLLAMWEEN